MAQAGRSQRRHPGSGSGPFRVVALVSRVRLRDAGTDAGAADGRTGCPLRDIVCMTSKFSTQCPAPCVSAEREPAVPGQHRIDIVCRRRCCCTQCPLGVLAAEMSLIRRTSARAGASCGSATTCAPPGLPWLTDLWLACCVDATVVFEQQGRLVIPAEVRVALGLVPGDRLQLHLAGPRLVLERQRDAVAELRALARDVPRSRSLVEELLADRRFTADTVPGSPDRARYPPGGGRGGPGPGNSQLGLTGPRVSIGEGMARRTFSSTASRRSSRSSACRRARPSGSASSACRSSRSSMTVAATR